jgi:hypothetical protein
MEAVVFYSQPRQLANPQIIQKRQANPLFRNILPINPYNSIFCGRDGDQFLANSNKPRILAEARKKNVSPAASLLPKELSHDEPDDRTTR